MRLNFSSTVSTATRAAALSAAEALVSQTVLFARGPLAQSGNSWAAAGAASKARKAKGNTAMVEKLRLEAIFCEEAPEPDPETGSCKRFYPLSLSGVTF